MPCAGVLHKADVPLMRPGAVECSARRSTSASVNSWSCLRPDSCGWSGRLDSSQSLPCRTSAAPGGRTRDSVSENGRGSWRNGWFKSSTCCGVVSNCVHNEALPFASCNAARVGVSAVVRGTRTEIVESPYQHPGRHISSVTGPDLVLRRQRC